MKTASELGTSAKAMTVIATASLLAGGGMAVASTASAEIAPVAVESACAQAAQSVAVRIANVQGLFAFDQNVVSSNEAIAGVFTPATAVLCGSPAEELIGRTPLPIIVSNNGDQQFEATSEDMSKESGDTKILACACAANLAGGGAIANAQVSGISLERIAKAAGL